MAVFTFFVIVTAHLRIADASDVFSPGRLFVADGNVGSVKAFDQSGTLIGTLSLPSSPSQAADVAFNYVRNVLYVTDRFGKVHVFDRTGTVVQTLQPPSAPAQLVGIAVAKNGTAYVAGSDGLVHVFANNGAYSRSIAVPNLPFLLFVTLSPDETRLLVTESNYFKGVHVFDLANGDAYLGTYGQTASSSYFAVQIAFASDGTLYVTDAYGTGTIEKYNPDGRFAGVFYTGVYAGWGLEVSPFDGTIWLGNTNQFASGVPKILHFNPDGTFIGGFGPYPALGQNAGMAFYAPPANTTTGSNVSFTPNVTLPNGTTTTMSLTFDNVTSSGDTSVTTSSAGQPPPAGFKLTNPPVYYEITTTAQFVGNVRVCMSWTEGQISNENHVTLFHYEAGHWVDITDRASIDTVNNKVCGTASSLSPFTLFEVRYPFNGFFQPVDNPPTFNRTKAGSAVPVRFSLGNNLGLNILAPGFPRVVAIQCDTGSPTDDIEQTVTAGESSLSYDQANNQYVYVWKTDKAWAGSCRQLQVGLDDGEVYTANFNLTK